MAEEACKDKILAGTRDEQLFSYDPSINYEPLKQYIVPRFSFFDYYSTDWSDDSESASGFSDSESETETMAKKEAQSQEDNPVTGFEEKHFFCDDLVTSTSRDLQYVAKDLATDLQSIAAVLNPSLLHYEELHMGQLSTADALCLVQQHSICVQNITRSSLTKVGCDINSVLTSVKDFCFGQLGILKVKINRKKVTWNRGKYIAICISVTKLFSTSFDFTVEVWLNSLDVK